MTNSPLQGTGVLVTRPRAQAAELVDKIQQMGGTACCLPVIDILPRAAEAIAGDLASMSKPDITLFVSRNAVEHGLAFADGARIGAIGPATAEAIEAGGKHVTIQSPVGFDSESLLNEPSLGELDGRTVRIIRGQDGRALLGDALRERGAIVEYLPVYDRALAKVDPEELDEIEAEWAAGRIQAVTAMSVESLHNLFELLPESCIQNIDRVTLVTPATRVIKEAQQHYPASRTVLASGPRATDMVDAIIGIS